MKPDQQTDFTLPASPAVPEPTRLAQLQSECALLRKRVAELEAERDQYRAEALVWARREFSRLGPLSEEELKRRIDQDEGVPLEAFLDELKRTAIGS